MWLYLWHPQFVVVKEVQCRPQKKPPLFVCGEAAVFKTRLEKACGVMHCVGVQSVVLAGGLGTFQSLLSEDTCIGGPGLEQDVGLSRASDVMSTSPLN